MTAEAQRPLLVLIDASSLIFRAFYAVRALSTRGGLPTNAVFGYATMVIKVIEELQPTHIAFAYDTKHPSFRKDRYPEYKANRGAMPDDLVPQIPYIKKFAEALALPGFEKPGFEADDLIGALTEAAQKRGEAVCIVTGDKDLMQLVNADVFLFDTMKNLKIDAQAVKAKLGVEPAQVADYLGLVGDSSDNIPGVPGIGPKSAAQLLQEYGSLENIYESLDKIKAGKQRDSLVANREQAFLSRELATVCRDVGEDFSFDALRCQPQFSQELTALLAELEFQKLGARLEKITPGELSAAKPSKAAAVVNSDAEMSASEAENKVSPLATKLDLPEPRFEAISELSRLREVFAEIPEGAVVAIDSETTGLSHSDHLVGFSFCFAQDRAFYVPLRHEILSQQINAEAALAELGAMLRKHPLVGQNIKFDTNVFRREGLSIPPANIFADTMLAAYLLEPGERHSMDELALRYLGRKTISYQEVCGTGKQQITFAQVPIDRATEYAAEDAWVTLVLYQILAQKLATSPSLDFVLKRIEMPLVPVLAGMEFRGVAVDSKLLGKLSLEFADELQRLEIQAKELAGMDFNLASPKQLQEVLFERLALPPSKKTKTGFSTDVEVLTKLAPLHELPRVILQHREIAKLKSTYVDVLPAISDQQGRVHTSYHQTVAATGRLSSSDPNLQNIPIRTELGKKIRAAFVARNGCVLLGADYSQIELRVLATLSRDEALLEAFRNGQDIHTMTASRIFHCAQSEVNADLRRKAKAINFGLIYGKTAFSLAEELEISRKEATEIIDTYFQQYPTIKNFLSGLAEKAKATGYAETLYGRRRIIAGINDRNKMVRAMAERMAVNTPLQGTAADLMKLAMIELDHKLENSGLAARMILQVHDELVLEVPESEVDPVRLLVKQTMETVGQLPGFPAIDVPLTVEIGVGRNWLEL